MRGTVKGEELEQRLPGLLNIQQHLFLTAVWRSHFERQHDLCLLVITQALDFLVGNHQTADLKVERQV